MVGDYSIRVLVAAITALILRSEDLRLIREANFAVIGRSASSTGQASHLKIERGIIVIHTKISIQYQLLTKITSFYG